MSRLFALVCVLIVVCETGCCGARRSRYSSCVPDASGACGGCGDVACSQGCGGGRAHRHRRAPLFGRKGGFWGGSGGDCCDSACDGGIGGCGAPMDGMTYSGGGGCSCGQGHAMDGASFSTTTNSMVPAPQGGVSQQVYSPAPMSPPPAPPMEPAPAPAPPPPGKIEPMSAEYFHPQATLVPPGASPTALQAPPLMQMPEIPAYSVPAAPPAAPPATIVPAGATQPAVAPPLLWVPSGVQQ